MIRQLPLAAFLMLLFALTAALPAAAQFLEAQDKTSSAEDVAIAFFKTANTQPPFDKWAMEADKIKIAPPARAPDMIAQERQRLVEEWTAFDPRKDVISLKTDIVIQLKITNDDAGHQVFGMDYRFERGNADFFPFTYRDYNIAVIPQMLDGVMSQPLEREQFERIKRGLSGLNSGRSTIYMQLRPAKAYLNRPYDIGGHDQWAFLTDIAAISITAPDTTAMWQYSAPWYVSRKRETLLNMYKDKGAENDMPALPAAPAESAPSGGIPTF